MSEKEFTGECTRCHRDPVDVGNPYGTLIVVVHPVGDFNLEASESPTGSTWVAICDECAPKLIEFLRPDLVGDPAWEAQRDQYDAMVRDWKADRYQ